MNNYIVGIIDSDLSTMTIGANGVKVYQALNNAYMTGFEASSIWSSSHFRWVNVINFTYGRDSENEILPQLPPLKLTSTFSFIGKNWDISPEIVGAIRKEEVRESYGELASPSWMIANLRVSYTFSKQNKWTLESGLENIFNSYYSKFLNWGQIPRPGRNFYINLSFTF
jgi:iron complex outermembrane receptor protein